VLINPSGPWAYLWTSEGDAATQALGLRRQVVEARDPTELERAFSDLARERAEALLVDSDALYWDHRKAIADLALKHRLPSMCEFREYVEAGGLMSFGVQDSDLYRRAATYVDKILKGTKPGDLPVEQPTKFELRVNLKTAKLLNLTIPPAVL